jgi:hypothetical protein
MSGRFAGGFIDERDPEAVEKWARDFFGGLDFRALAERHGTEPTIEAVAESYAQKSDPATREVLRAVCEEELRRGKVNCR